MSSQANISGTEESAQGIPQIAQNDDIVFNLDVEQTLRDLLAQEDTDHDMQITVEDTGAKGFPLPLPDGKGTYDLKGSYMLSNLLQELTLAKDDGQKQTTVALSRLNENPVHRLSRRIANDFWDMLTRRIDASSVEKAALDTKDWTGNPQPRIYVPHGEPKQFEFYKKVAADRPEINLDVQMLPEEINPILLRELSLKPGLLAIAMEEVPDKNTGETTLQGVPFVVPGGRFNEFYGWDSYFIGLGVLANDRADLAKGMVTNLCFCIKHYGKILNATRSYYLCRSQPPFLTDLTLRVYDKIQGEEGSKEWLRTALLAAIKEYSSIWTSEPRFDKETGLSRYRPDGIGVPMETEKGHFKHVLAPYAEKYGMSQDEFAEAYTWEKLKEPVLDEYFMHDRAIRESGHDTSYRLEDRCGSLATVDLNCLLYKYETDIAHAIFTYFDDNLVIPSEYAAGSLQADEVHTSSLWTQRAEERKAAIHKYCWDPERGVFFDYDTVKKERTGYESATTLWALWAGVANKDQAASLVERTLPALEVAGGLVSTSKESVGDLGPGRPQRQWDYPYGWAPHQIMAWKGLQDYGFKEEAARLAYRWLYMMTKTFRDYNGVVVEKYDVTKETDPHRADAEYGNQGLGFKGVAKEGFGWVNSSYVIGLQVLDDDSRRGLEEMIPYEEYKKTSG
ncbi:probable neutral trehalase [Cephalotrichum gorgonifer]|uniref:Trehalase n=1 Tax=Cephalotrichum gorgonifer TaxID=2041049 RepID=A0AAE8SZC0_9PEZI|nr:probable neutral trehalase [Cephalotrichum gorgonifer]